jgi:hypothetical protein
MLQLWEVPVQGGEWRRLAESEAFDCAADWSPDGRLLAFTRTIRQLQTLGNDIFLYDFDQRTVVPFLPATANRHTPAFSPDGRWLAYSSNESGRAEVYVTSYADRANTATVSQGGGETPFWSRDGRTLYYRTLQPATGASVSLMSVDVRAGRTLALGPPRTIARLPEGFIAIGPGRCVDLHPDGRFLVGRWTRPFPVLPVTRLHVVQNWFSELERLSPKPR